MPAKWVHTIRDGRKRIKELLSIIDDLMPGVPHIVIDIGKLNTGLIEAEKYLRETKGLDIEEIEP